MPKVKISEYSATANSNTDVASINIDEGCAPSGINNAIRAVMGHLKDFQQGTNGDPFNGPVNGTVGATTANTAVVTTLNSTDTTDASSTTAAAMKTAGGLAVAKKAYIGLDANIYGLTVGRGAGAVSTNTAVGASALAANTSGSYNTALGNLALTANQSGSGNVAIGFKAGTATLNNFNTAVGGGFTGFTKAALEDNTTGAYNIGIGSGALGSNTTASNNTAVGYQAGYSNTTGTESVYIGQNAGYSGTTNGQNTFVGRYAGYSNTGNYNAFFGYGAGNAITSGTKNTILGRYDGNYGGLDIRTASNYIVLSDGDGNPRIWVDGSGNTNFTAGHIGLQSSTSGIFFGTNSVLPSTGTALSDNAKSMGNASWRWSVIYAGTGTINTSDAYLKQDEQLLTEAERKVAVAIKGLIRTFRFKDAVAEKGAAARIHIGVMAQSVRDAFIAEGLDANRYAMFCSDTWVDEETNEEKTRLGIRYDELLAFVIAAL